MALYSTTGKQYVGRHNGQTGTTVYSPDLIDGSPDPVYDGSSNDIIGITPITITNGTSTEIIPAQGEGVGLFLTDISLSNASAAAVTVDLRAGVGGAVKWTFGLPGSGLGGSVNHSFQEPLQFPSNSGIFADPSASGSSITISANARKYSF